MAHVMKMTRGACGHMFKHYERAKDEKGEFIKFGNQDIDTNKTHLNYNLAPHNNYQGAFVKQRCSEVSCLNRKDVNVACTWVVTLPRDYKEMNPGKSEKEFFQGAYNFLEKRYGKENVVSAHVHNDEITPHMHFSFVPVVYDKKKEKYKVSAKERVGVHDLKTFHGDLKEHLQKEYGLDCNVLNQATVEGNKSIEELKRGTAIKQLQEVQKATETSKEELQNLEMNKTALEGKIQSLEGKVLSLQEVNNIKIKKPLFGGNKAIINMSYEDAINLKKTASFVETAQEQVKQVNDDKVELKKAIDLLKQKKEEVSKIPLNQQLEKAKLVKENKELSQELNVLTRVMEKRPDLYQEIKKEVNTLMQPQKNKGFEMER